MKLSNYQKVIQKQSNLDEMKTNLMKDFINMQKFRKETASAALGALPGVDTDTDKKEESIILHLCMVVKF